MTSNPKSLYDLNDYYKDNRRGSRLSPVLDGLLVLFEWERVLAVGRLLQHALRHKGKKSLDVGAGDGKFLHMMRRFGLTPFGTTASSRSADAAAALYGIELNVSESLVDVAENGPFALVTYWHVYEHLAAPSEHEQKWSEILEKDGLLVIEVPNIDSYGAKICYDSWLGSDPIHHINHQRPEALLERIRNAGLKPFRTSYFSAKFTYVFLWSALLGRLFPKAYTFDGIMELLKSPLEQIRQRPLMTLNALFAIVYLVPFVAYLAVLGVLKRKGEVIRIYARK